MFSINIVLPPDKHNVIHAKTSTNKSPKRSYLFLTRILEYFLKDVYKRQGIQIAMGHPVKGGLMFPHFSGIVINGGAKIGRNCTILHGVTIGSVRGPKGGVPTIGDNVVIATGSAVIGNVSVGNNVMIGAHSLVLQDIPDSAVVVGNPARIVSMDGAEKTKYYL